jgi:hypothetical protein
MVRPPSADPPTSYEIIQGHGAKERVGVDRINMIHRISPEAAIKVRSSLMNRLL